MGISEFKADLGNIARPHLKIQIKTISCCGHGSNLIVNCLPAMHTRLGFISCTDNPPTKRLLLFYSSFFKKYNVFIIQNIIN